MRSAYACSMRLVYLSGQEVRNIDGSVWVHGGYGENLRNLD